MGGAQRKELAITTWRPEVNAAVLLPPDISVSTISRGEGKSQSKVADQTSFLACHSLKIGKGSLPSHTSHRQRSRFMAAVFKIAEKRRECSIFDNNFQIRLLITFYCIGSFLCFEGFLEMHRVIASPEQNQQQLFLLMKMSFLVPWDV